MSFITPEAKIHMIFLALGSLLNFQIQAEQNSIALLMLMYYQQAFLRVAAVFRRRRF